MTNATCAKDFRPWLAWLDERQSQMLEHTIALANINSGSLNAAGVNRVAQQLIEYAAPLGAEITSIPVAPFEQIDDSGQLVEHPVGDALLLTKRPEAPLQIFFCAHMDTVFAIDSDFQQVTWLDDNTINGPGVTDLKGGIMVMLNALEAFERSPYAERIGWQILFNPDEEIGSKSSAYLIEEAAKRAHLGMIYEPCFPSGDFAGQRKGSGNFSVVCKGVAAHAGREHHLGRNAVRAMSEFIIAIDDLNGQREGVTINPARVDGGGANNVVPELCIHHFNIRLERPEDELWCLQHIERIKAEINAKDGISLSVHGSFGRKPKVLTQANQQLLDLACRCGAELGLTIKAMPTGGCCDGNNLAAAGVPNIDTLGVQGGAIHSSDEYLIVSSLSERAKLSALLLLTLATSEDLSWLEKKPC